jgi:outer membrane protein TolC
VEGREFAGDAGFRNGSVTLTLSLPWWNRAAYRHDLERDRQKLHAVEQEGVEAALTLRNEIHHELIEIANARREVVATRQELLPRTDQALQAALAAWSSNRGLIADVLDARRMHLDARLSEARALAEQWTRIHSLALRCGLTARETLRLAGAPNANATPVEAPHSH